MPNFRQVLDAGDARPPQISPFRGGRTNRFLDWTLASRLLSDAVKAMGTMEPPFTKEQLLQS
jgi:hypothetical protein